MPWGSLRLIYKNYLQENIVSRYNNRFLFYFYLYLFKKLHCLLTVITISNVFRRWHYKNFLTKKDFIPISADLRIGVWQGKYYKMWEFYNPEEVEETGEDKLIHTEVILKPK